MWKTPPEFVRPRGLLFTLSPAAGFLVALLSLSSHQRGGGLVTQLCPSEGFSLVSADHVGQLGPSLEGVGIYGGNMIHLIFSAEN